jgi:hypothetical protein
VGEVKCLGAARLAANSFPAKSAKEQKNRSLGDKKNKRKKTTHFQILKTTRFL